MSPTIFLAILAGAGLGYVIERGDFCFHSTWRGVYRKPQDLNLMRAYWLVLLVSVPLVQGMILLGWIEPWVPPFAWKANLLGGLVFGLGMVVAATCVTGLFYKLGHGMLGVLVGLAAWAVGDVFTYLGPFSSLRESLNADPLSVNGASATVLNMFGLVGVIFTLGLGVVTAVYLYRAPRPSRDKLWSWPVLGLAIGVVISLAWLLARVGGANYPYGTSRVPTGLVEAIGGATSGGSLWIPVALISIIPGAFLAAWLSGTLWVRGETFGRYVQLAVGGFLMGVGAAIAGGCNLGHSLVGVPLLSLGSIATTLAMGFGVFLGHRLVTMRIGQQPQAAGEATS